MSVLGARAVRDALFAVGGIDSGTLLNWQNQEGIDEEQMLNTVAGAIGTANEEAVARWSAFTYITRAPEVMYRQGSGLTKTSRAGEVSNPDPRRGKRSGHMLPLHKHDDALAWTHDYLKRAYTAWLTTDISEVVDAWHLRVDADMINRLMSPTEEAVGDGGGVSVGFADASAGTVTYTPPNYGQVAFTSSHNHYNFTDGTVTAANLQAAMFSEVANLREHGIMGRLTALVAEDDVDTWSDADKFVELVPAEFQYTGGVSDPAQTTDGEFEAGMPGERFGFLNTPRGYVELRYEPLIPTGYFNVSRTYGPNNPNNPLAIRLDRDTDFGLMPQIMVTRSASPKIDSIEFVGWHGVGTNSRLNGASHVVASGASAYTWTEV